MVFIFTCDQVKNLEDLVFYCTYPFIDFHCNICVDEIINLMST